MKTLVSRALYTSARERYFMIEEGSRDIDLRCIKLAVIIERKILPKLYYKFLQRLYSVWENLSKNSDFYTCILRGNK